MNDYFLQAAAQGHIDALLESAARGRRAHDARLARRAERRAARARARDVRDFRDKGPAAIDLREIASEISTGQELTAICGR